MITLRPGSHAYRLLLLLSVAGEFPTRSMRLLGSVRSLEALVYRLEQTQQFRNESGADLGRCRMLSVSGKRDRRTIRLHKTALPLLNALHPAALEQYLALSGEHRFSSSDGHVQRNHRVAETLAVCMGAGVEFRPYELPALQKQRIVQIVPTFPAFYTARSLKRLDSTEMNKTIFTRLTGALFAQETCWAVYNTRGAVMKWSGMGEFKTAQHLAELARMNAGLPRADHALLLGECMDIALRTMEESDKSRRMELRFDRIYPHIHFIPLDRQGIRLLRILMLPNWNEQVLSAVFPSEWRVVGPGIIERDAQRDGQRVVSIDAERTVETDTDKLRSDLLDLVESLKGKKILTGTIQGVERLADNPEMSYAVTYHGDYKVIIPVLEAVEEPEDYRGQPKGDVLHYLLNKRLGAEVDYIIKGIDQESGVVAASRLEAMAMKRKEYYFRTDRDGNYQIYAGICAEARVVSVIRAGIFVDLFGAECYIPLRELSYQRWVDATAHYQSGQRVLVRVLEVDRDHRSQLRVSASVKQAGENPYEKALKKYAVGSLYVGTVSMVDTTGVFVSLDGGIDCLCTYPKRGRPPRGCRVSVRILGINYESNRIWGVITHMSTVR